MAANYSIVPEFQNDETFQLTQMIAGEHEGVLIGIQAKYHVKFGFAFSIVSSYHQNKTPLVCPLFRYSHLGVMEIPGALCDCMAPSDWRDIIQKLTGIRNVMTEKVRVRKRILMQNPYLLKLERFPMYFEYFSCDPILCMHDRDEHWHCSYLLGFLGGVLSVLWALAIMFGPFMLGWLLAFAWDILSGMFFYALFCSRRYYAKADVWAAEHLKLADIPCNIQEQNAIFESEIKDKLLAMHINLRSIVHNTEIKYTHFGNARRTTEDAIYRYFLIQLIPHTASHSFQRANDCP